MTKRVPARILALRNQILANATKTCSRCDGRGERPDSARWVVTTDKTGAVQGKFCFRCRGTGTEPARGITDPLTVRYKTADDLLPLVEAGDVDAIAAEEDSQDKAGIYWPILVDVYGRAMAAAARNRRAARSKAKKLKEAMADLPGYAARALVKHHSDASYEALCEAVGADCEFLPWID